MVCAATTTTTTMTQYAIKTHRLGNISGRWNDSCHTTGDISPNSSVQSFDVTSFIFGERCEKLFHHLFPKNWSFLMTYVAIFRFEGQFNHCRCLSRKPVVSAKYRFSKESGTRSHQGRSVPAAIFLAHQDPISFAMNPVFILQASLPS